MGDCTLYSFSVTYYQLSVHLFITHAKNSPGIHSLLHQLTKHHLLVWIDWALLTLGACARGTVVVLCVCPCVCLLATAPTATYLVYTSKVRRYWVSYRLLKICIVWTSLKSFCSGDMASFAYHNDRRLGSFSTKNTPMILDMITNGTVYELIARSDINLK